MINRKPARAGWALWGGGEVRSVRWAANESGGLKSLRRSDEGRCIHRPAGSLAGGQGVRSDPESEGFEEKYRAAIEWERWPPERLLAIWLDGHVEFETSDGEVRRLPAGKAVLVEDTHGKGHISRHPEEGQNAIIVILPSGLDATT